MIRPRFTEKERVLLIQALRCYSVHLKIAVAEFDGDVLARKVLWNKWRITNDLGAIRDYWTTTHRIEKATPRNFKRKAEATDLLARRLELYALGVVHVRSHSLHTTSTTRFLLREIEEPTLLNPVVTVGHKTNGKRE